MKLTLALLATLLSVGLVRGDEAGPAGTLGTMTEASRPGGVKTGRDVHASVQGGDVHSKPQDSTVVKPIASEPFVGETIELFDALLADFQSRIQDSKAKVEFEKLVTEVQDPEFIQQALKEPKVVEETIQKILKISKDPTVQKACQTFIEKPEVQSIAKKMVAEAMEMQRFAEEMFANSLLDALAQPVYYEFEFFPTDPASFPLMDMQLPENIAEKYHGNLFKAVDLHDSVFASEEAPKLVEEKRYAVQNDKDAQTVFNYLMQGKNAEAYHQLMVEEKKMTLPKPRIEEVHDTSA